MANRKKYAKSFEKWLREDVEMTFGIKRMDELDSLNTWLKTDYSLTPAESEAISALHFNLKKELDYYNEDELKLFFISEILKISHFKSDIYRAFSQRTIEFSAKTLDNELIHVKGIVDLLVARGLQTPKTPYFFIQEFKPSLKHYNDPLGQLLIAMYGTQVNNQNQKPAFGSYILGKDWYFVTLEKNEYAVSRSYDATILEDLKRLICFLKVRKMEIEKELGLI